MVDFPRLFYFMLLKVMVGNDKIRGKKIGEVAYLLIQVFELTFKHTTFPKSGVSPLDDIDHSSSYLGSHPILIYTSFQL